MSNITVPLVASLWMFILAILPSMGNVWLTMSYSFVLPVLGILDLVPIATLTIFRTRRTVLSSALLSLAIGALWSGFGLLFGHGWTDYVAITLQILLFLLSIHHYRKIRKPGLEIHPLDLPVFG